MPREAVIDEAWSRVSLDGRDGVIRYFSYDNSGKTLTLDEFRNYRAQNKEVGGVWETTATRASDGFDAGASDARECIRQANAIGFGGILYFAVDEDVDGPQVEAYFRGVNSVMHVSSIGAYGGIRIIRWLFDHGLISYGWQTAAWSYGHIDSRACLWQNDFHNSYDGNVVLKPDWGQYPRPARPQSKLQWYVVDVKSKREVGRGDAVHGHSYSVGTRRVKGQIQWCVLDRNLKHVVGYRKMNPGRKVALKIQAVAA
ncbi:MAG: glycoside hydrolase domain-containing protein [Actinomycetota bacterium]